MPRKLNDVDRDDLVRRYLAGESGNQLARRYGVLKIVVYGTLRRRGIPRRHLPHRKVMPTEEIAALYRSGESVNALAKKYGVSRRVIEKRLNEAGVARRGQSEAELLKWSRMSEAQRSRQVAKANEAARGSKHSLAHRCKVAATREVRRLGTSPNELKLARLLRRRGVSVTLQKAIGPYNCDLGIAPVAVEVFGGEWHFGGRHLARTPRRVRYLMEAGWHVLMIRTSPRRDPITSATADYVVAYLERARGNPAAGREYRVIRSNGELLAAGGEDDEQISVVPTLRLGSDPATGRNESVAR